MKLSKLTSYAKINLDLKIKYYDKIIKKHKISSKVVLLKLNDLIKVSNSTKLQITYYDQNKKIIKLKNDIIKKSILFFDRKYKTKTKLKFYTIFTLGFNNIVNESIDEDLPSSGSSSKAAKTVLPLPLQVTPPQSCFGSFSHNAKASSSSYINIPVVVSE